LNATADAIYPLPGDVPGFLSNGTALDAIQDVPFVVEYRIVPFELVLLPAAIVVT
jgi:hypothetical protein